MPAKKYHVELSVEERATLEQMLRRGKHSARRLTRARILLKAADGLRDVEIAEAVETSLPTIERTRKRFAEVAETRESEVRASFRKAGVDALELATDDDLVDAIMRFADLRKRRSQLAAGGSFPQHLEPA